MDLSDAFARMSRGNAILFGRDSPCLADLREELTASDRRTVALWGLTEAERIAVILSERYPSDQRPGEAVRVSREWAEGMRKMPDARRTILAVHAMSGDVLDPVDSALCHAVGQGCSCVHTPGHALGLPMYELTAMMRDNPDGCEACIEAMVSRYVVSLRLCRERSADVVCWAGFLRRLLQRLYIG